MNQFGGALDHGAGILAFVHQRLAQEDGYHRLAFILGGSHYGELDVRELAAQQRQNTTDHFRRYFALQTHQFDLAEVLGAVDQIVTEMRNLLCHKLLDLLLQTRVLFDRSTDSACQIRGVVEQTAQTGQHILLAVIQFVRTRSRHGFYTAHTGCYAGLHDDA